MENVLEGRIRQRKKANADPVTCPVCSCTLRANEFDQHFALELERLQKLSANSGKTRKSSNSSPEMQPTSSSGSSRNSTGRVTSGESSSASAVGTEKCWGTYQKIKNNRQARLKLKSRKRKAEENVCPVCNQRTTEDLTIHVELCLRKSEANGSGATVPMSDDESIDVEGDTYEEYEWAGQTRIRTCTLLPGGNYSAALASTSTKITTGDSDDELNVDGDEPQIYGPAQYSERDIIVNDDSSYLRELVTGHPPKPQPATASIDDTGEGSSSVNGQHENNQNLLNDTSPLSSPDASPKTDAANQVIESLKAKIREYERYFQNKPKCLICLDDYKNPVVSICCWHVACEVCFLNQLGTKKLCPQCNMITSPADLRRIYL